MAENLKTMRADWLDIFAGDTGVVKRWETTNDGIAYAKRMAPRYEEYRTKGEGIKQFIRKWDGPQPGETPVVISPILANQMAIEAARLTRG